MEACDGGAAFAAYTLFDWLQHTALDSVMHAALALENEVESHMVGLGVSPNAECDAGVDQLRA